jgi:DNA polymerase I-like protein with 3'-5' exonuclease and polymerase domains
VTASGISPEVVAGRAYRSVSARDELRGLGFPRDIARHLPALAIPVYAVRHLDPGERLEPSGLLLRPDTIYSFKDGRTAKYLSPSSQENVLDVHPAAREWLLDVAAPLVLTEGVLKADAAVSVGLAAIGLGGVDGGWRNGAPLPAWELIPLKGRQTLVAFDSDVTVKTSVRSALDRLVGYLQRRGAEVEIVVLPPGPHGAKTGLDDFLAAHRGSQYPIGLLLEHAVAAGEIPQHDEQPTPELPKDVTGADVLDGLSDLLTRYIRFGRPEQTWAVVLWVAHTHFVELFEIVAYLAVSSATMRSGKTHLLDLIRWTCARGRRMSGGSDAAIFRTLASQPPPSLAFDEVDHYIGEHSERSFLIALLNEGFERDGVVARVEDNGGKREVVDYSVFGPKVFTGIGKLLPPTTLDRCIPIRLERRLRSERVAKFRARPVQQQAAGVRSLLAGWAAVASDTVAEHYDSELAFPFGTNERAEDVWEPLLAVAEAAGGEWPQRARQAMLVLTPADDDSGDLAVVLLADIRQVFADADWPQALKSGALVKALNALEDAPWGGLRDGKGLSTHKLARDLASFGLFPERDQLDGETVCGWWRRSLGPVWGRYLPELDDDGQDAKNGESPEQRVQSVGVPGLADFRPNQAETDSDTSHPQTGPADRSVGAETAANRHFPDTPTLSRAETAETRNQARSESIAGQINIFEAIEMVEAEEARSATLDIGTGGALEVHRLPPDAAGEQREQLRSFLAESARRSATLALDCETTGTDPYAPRFATRIWSLSDGRHAWAVDARDLRSTGELAEQLARYPGSIALHNITFDVPVAIRELGLDVDSFTSRARDGGLVDTMILARLCRPDERRVGLKEIAKLELGAGAAAAEERLRLAFKHLRGKAETKWRDVDPAHPAYWQYAAVDAALTARLHERFRADVDDELLTKEMRVALICLRAGLRGWPVDADAAAALERDLLAEQRRLEQVLRRFGITNVSTAAGRAAITDALRREGHTPAGTSLAKETLEPLALAGSQIARDVLALRTTQKFLSLYVPMFLGAADPDGRLHAFPLTLGTVTGRMSLPGVPLQTAPKGELELAAENGTLTAAIRSALVAGDGELTASVDFTTMELRIAAALSADVRLRAVVDAGDAHTAVAKRLFQTETPTAKQRATAKTVNFGVLYGMGGEGLARRLRIADEQARRFVARWWDSFPAVRKLRDRLAGEERRSLWGRLLPNENVPEHIALNHVIQGYGRDIFCDGLLALEDAGFDERLLLPLHDEYVLRLAPDGAVDAAREISSLVASRLGDVELPVEATIGAATWASVAGAEPLPT